jgi:hypothetical protein
MPKISDLDPKGFDENDYYVIAGTGTNNRISGSSLLLGIDSYIDNKLDHGVYQHITSRNIVADGVVGTYGLRYDNGIEGVKLQLSEGNEELHMSVFDQTGTLIKQFTFGDDNIFVTNEDGSYTTWFATEYDLSNATYQYISLKFGGYSIWYPDDTEGFFIHLDDISQQVDSILYGNDGSSLLQVTYSKDGVQINNLAYPSAFLATEDQIGQSINYTLAGTVPSRNECIVTFKQLRNYKWSDARDYFINDTTHGRVFHVSYQPNGDVDEAGTSKQFWYILMTKAV